MSNNSIDLQSILNSAKSQLPSLGVNGASSTSGNNPLNSIWGLVQNGETAINDNDQQKAQAITNIVQNLMSMLTSLGTNENAKATNEVNNNDKNADKLAQNADKKANDIQAEIKTIVNDIATNSNNISDAIERIKELGGSEDDIQAAKENLDKQVQIIEENLAIVNDGVSSPEAKQNALALIKGASAEITNIVSKMNILTEETQKQIQEQNAIVESSTNNIATLIEKSVTTISNGTVDLQSYIQQGVQQTVTNTTTATTGAANEVVGATATTSGTATSWVPIFGQTASSKLIQIGADQTAAGATRIGGSAKTLASLTQAIGKMGTDINSIVGTVSSIEGVGNGAIALVGNYQTKLDSIITATGSWSQVADANKDLTSAIAEYEGQGISTNFWEQMNGSQTQEGSENKTFQGTGAINFDVNRFKTAFGI